MKMIIDEKELHFVKTGIRFIKNDIHSLFKTKNNKSLRETLQHPRYNTIQKKLSQKSESELNKPLGDLLIEMKEQDNPEYKYFLNKYGDNVFCEFVIEKNLEDKGIYAWVVNKKIKYIGRCTDNFKKRVNQGYGKINAKNCYKDGQSTNCHLNSEINKSKNVEFYVCIMNQSNTEEINELELKILNNYNFEWNIQNN